MARAKKTAKKITAGNGGIQELLKELWQAAVTLRGSTSFGTPQKRET